MHLDADRASNVNLGRGICSGACPTLMYRSDKRSWMYCDIIVLFCDVTITSSRVGGGLRVGQGGPGGPGVGLRLG